MAVLDFLYNNSIKKKSPKIRELSNSNEIFSVHLLIIEFYNVLLILLKKRKKMFRLLNMYVALFNQ